MEILRQDAVTLAYQPQDSHVAHQLHQVFNRVAPWMGERWGLPRPQELWLFTLDDSWVQSTFFCAPAPWRPVLALSFPFWFFRARRIYPFAGGWQQQFGGRSVVGVKPPRLLLSSDRSLGQRIYNPEPDLNRKVEQLACHELAHAFTARLRLPAWLNEGLAMTAVDLFAGANSVKLETLAVLRHSPGRSSPGNYLRVSVANADAMLYLYVRGYWLVRYFEETQPGLLKRLLRRRVSHRALEKALAQSLGMSRQAFWRQVDGIVADYFKKTVGAKN